MKKELKNKLIFISGVVFALALLFVSVQLIRAAQTNTWSAPTKPFPQADVYPPLTTSPDISVSTPEIREGSLKLQGMVEGNKVGWGGVLQMTDEKAVGGATGRWIGMSDGYFMPKTSASDPRTKIYSLNPFQITAKGFILPQSIPSGMIADYAGMVYYNATDKKAQIYNGTAWTDLGGGGVLKPTVILTGNSGSVGMILNKDSNDASGTNSPMLVFDGFGAPKIGFLEQKNSNIFSSLFRAEQTHAALLPCDNNGGDGISSCGGGGMGNPGPIDGLTQPIWWMRQQGTAFSVMASDPTLNDLRYSLTLTKGGGVLAGGPNNSTIPGNGEFFEYRKNLGDYVQTAPSGMWCGFDDGNMMQWDCAGANAGQRALDACPLGWKIFKFGKHSGLSSGNDWKTCIKL